MSLLMNLLAIAPGHSDSIIAQKRSCIFFPVLVYGMPGVVQNPMKLTFGCCVKAHDHASRNKAGLDLAFLTDMLCSFSAAGRGGWEGYRMALTASSNVPSPHCAA